MREPGSEALLVEALSRCLERLAKERGLTVEECVRDYPQYRDALKPLIEVAILLRKGANCDRFRRDMAQFMSKRTDLPVTPIIGATEGTS